ncbi:MAG: MMPL family transporter, partial [Pseudomonadales bacterium]|nr:MMPL family transporter [Pseudomonadales bacterium]
MNLDRLINTLAYRRNILAVVTLIIVLGLSSGAKNIYFESDYKIFFSQDNPQLNQQDLIEDEYTNSDNVTLIISTRQKNLFNQTDLTAIIGLTEAAWQLPNSIRVDSLSNYQYTHASEDDLFVEDLIPISRLDSPAKIKQIEKIALSEPELKNLVISPEGTVTSITVLLNLPENSVERDQASAEIIAATRTLIQDYETRYPDLTIYLAGQTTVAATFNELSQRDSKFWLPIMFAVMALLLLVTLKSLIAMGITLVVVAMSVSATIGTMGWLHFPLNQITAVLPAIILILGICNCVHLLNSFRFHTRSGEGSQEGLRKMIETNLTPVFLTTLTTAIGFASMNFSDTPPFRELGTWAAVGTLFAFLLSLTLLPALAYYCPATAQPEQSQANTGIAARYSAFLIKHRHLSLAATCGLLLFLVCQIPNNQLNDNTLGYFKKSVPLREAADFMQEHLTGFDNFSYSLNCQQSNCINTPAYLETVQKFTDWLESQPEIVRVISYTDVIKRLNKNMHNDDDSYYRIPDSKALAAQYQLLYELSLPFGLDLNNQINMDKSALKITAVIKGQKAKELLDLEQRIDTWLQTNTPELHAPGAGLSLMFAHLGQRNIESMVAGSLVALAFVTLTLMIALRSIRYGLVSLIPNSFPALAAF